MPPLAGLNARVVIDLFDGLPKEERHVFFKLLGQRLAADEPVRITSEMPIIEREKWAQMYLLATTRNYLSIMAETAIQMERAFPGKPTEELAKMLREDVLRQFDKCSEATAKVEAAKLKKQRDRPSKPETIRRNMEICDLWSRGGHTQGQLALKYGLKPADIRKIIKAQAKWRQLGAGLSPD